jgi:LacI family transcriptional regulator
MGMTIREFARSIGVSPTTVTRAIHGRGRISPETRQMVLARMPEMGFTPNVNAQRLSHGRTNMIALDFGSRNDYLSDPFFVEITRDILETLESRGYGLLLSGHDPILDRWVRTRAVDGVILIGSPAFEEEVPEIVRLGAACVIVANSPYTPVPGVGSVYVDLEPGARQVARCLVRHGHRRVGYIYGDSEDGALSAFRDELTHLGGVLPEGFIVRGVHSPWDADQALCRLMALPDPPTAIFARTDGFATGVLGAAHRLGLRVPEDLSLVGHDDIPFAQWAHPALTTVRVDCIELARLATDTLFTLLDDTDAPVNPRSVRTTLVVRDSVGAPRPTSGVSTRRPDRGGQAARARPRAALTTTARVTRAPALNEETT